MNPEPDELEPKPLELETPAKLSVAPPDETENEGQLNPALTPSNH
jgi:hypothetical protein